MTLHKCLRHISTQIVIFSKKLMATTVKDGPMYKIVGNSVLIKLSHSKRQHIFLNIDLGKYYYKIDWLD